MSKVVELFTQSEVDFAFRQKRKLFVLWIFALVGYLAFIFALMGINLYRVANFYDRSDRVWMSILAVLLTIVFVVGTMFFFATKYALTKSYVKMLKEIVAGQKDTQDVEFVCFDDTKTIKDGVTFYTMVTKAKPLGRTDITERRILIEHTKPKPHLEEGERLGVVTHANILIGIICQESVKDKKEQVSCGQ